MAIDAKFTADFSDFNKETKKAQASMTDFEKAATNVGRSLATDFLAAFSVGALTAFVSDVVASASALKVLSAQTQINTDDLQIMTQALSEYGVSQDEVGKAMGQLSKRIAGGGDSVASALATMGIALKDVQNLSGKELFLKIENGLATLKGSLRDTTAAALFGDKLGAAMAGASEGIDGTMAKARELNTVMSKESIDALDAYDAAMNRAKQNLKSYAANTIGPLAEGFNVLAGALDRGASKWDVFTSMLPKGFGLVGKGAEHLTTIIDQQNQAVEQNAAAAAQSASAHAATTRVMSEEEKALQFLRILRSNAAKELTDAQVRHLEELKRIGQLTEANAKGVGVSAAEYKKYIQSLEDAKKAAADLAASQREADALMLTSYRSQMDNLKTLTAERMKAYGTVEQIRMLRELEAAELNLTKTVYSQITSEKDRLAMVEQSGKRRIEINNQIMALESQRTQAIAQQLLAEAQAHQQRNAALGLDAQGYVKVESAAETLRVKLAELDALQAQGIPTTERRALAMEEFAQANYEAARATDQVISANHQAAQSFEELAASMRKEVEERRNRQQAGALPTGIIGRNGVATDMFGRPVVAGGGLSQLPIVNVNVDGNIIGTEAELARLFGQAMTGTYRSGGNRMPA